MNDPLSRRRALCLAGATAATVFAGPGLAAGPKSSGLFVRQSRADRSLTIISSALTQEEARASMPDGAFEYVHGASGDEWTLRQNIEHMRALAFSPHRLAGFSKADTSATLFGRALPAPIYVCPMGAQDIVHVDAELASVRGANRAGLAYLLSSASNRSLEEVARATPEALRLFAIYLNDEPAVNVSLARRARQAGYAAIIMTIDSLGPGSSERYRAMGSPGSPNAGYGNFDPRRGGSGKFQRLKKDFKPSDIAMLREASGLPVMVKGVLRPDDAERCLAAGAAGIVVSNHGGRTLDGAPAAIDVLAAIVHAIGGRVPVLFDSGVRRGEDVVRALALGATAVGVGRPVLDAMALGGATGVADMLEWFKSDLATAMLLVGAPRVADLSRDYLQI
ncbi:alpha-hydroxy acid oxidase [Sphingomonas sp. PAMC 26617]|uniref:alpha-hydroxy acid oxidase n=1 Tax=Sphingomonas sp. PAMC 26617 TaxID=1112216 RepID=UPI0002896C98|nr:alpha-hydroxy acid oxidase [Sphingomonas sp. PAMC 26617]